MSSNHRNSNLSVYPEDSSEKEDFVSELPEPQNNRRTKVAAYCLDFTFEPSTRQERRLRWSQLL